MTLAHQLLNDTSFTGYTELFLRDRRNLEGVIRKHVIGEIQHETNPYVSWMTYRDTPHGSYPAAIFERQLDRF
jgi:hypothetical protein